MAKTSAVYGKNELYIKHGQTVKGFHWVQQPLSKQKHIKTPRCTRCFFQCHTVRIRPVFGVPAKGLKSGAFLLIRRSHSIHLYRLSRLGKPVECSRLIDQAPSWFVAPWPVNLWGSPASTCSESAPQITSTGHIPRLLSCLRSIVRRCGENDVPPHTSC